MEYMNKESFNNFVKSKKGRRKNRKRNGESESDGEGAPLRRVEESKTRKWKKSKDKI